jgi:hypothetical protein
MRNFASALRGRSVWVPALLAAGLLQGCGANVEHGTNTWDDELSASADSEGDTIACEAATAVSVTLTGENTTSVTPIDLMLVVDESGSISRSSFSQLRSFLGQFTQSMQTLFANGGRIGLSMFSGSAERWPNYG